MMTFGRIYWFLDYFRGHPDQSSRAELETLSVLVHGKTMLEIGSWMGCSTLALARAAQQNGGKVFCCDAWQGTPVDDLSSISRRHDVFGAFWRRICRAGLADVVIPLRGKSEDVLPVLADGTFDFVYIDGDHRYEAVRHDIFHALRLIHKGGTIAGHDYDVGHPDVIKAVNEAFGQPDFKGRVWWAKR